MFVERTSLASTYRTAGMLSTRCRYVSCTSMRVAERRDRDLPQSL
jgi:hypothetical protein